VIANARCESFEPRPLLEIELLASDHNRRPCEIALEAARPLPASVIEEIVEDCRRLAIEGGAES
jgi:hypothetical protein